MAGKCLPENNVVHILSSLPINSLIRFHCVSKQWYSITFDPQFAKLQFEKKNPGRRKLLDFLNDSDIESLNLETPSLWSSIRKLTCPFQYEDRLCHRVMVIGSCNGLVCVAPSFSFNSLYIWNPSIDFSLKLPHPGFPSHIKYISNYSGFGYLPATDDYKVLVAANHLKDSLIGLHVRIFSTRSGLWKRIESPFKSSNPGYITSAALLGVTLHWVIHYQLQSVIHAFDLVKEECRKILTPTKHLLAVDSSGGFLYGFRIIYDDCRSFIELWVMREYGVSDSWTKLFKLQLDHGSLHFAFLDTKSSTVLAKLTRADKRMEIIRIEHEEDEPIITDRLNRRYHIYGMIIYDESLLRIPDYHAAISYKVDKTTDGLTKLKFRRRIGACCPLALFNYLWLNILILTIAYLFSILININSNFKS